MTDLEDEAVALATIDVLNAAKDLLDLFEGAREFKVRMTDDGVVKIYLPDGRIKWKAN